MSKVKVAYLIVTRSFPGLLKQMEYDAALAQDLQNVEWRNYTFLDDFEGGGDARPLPVWGRGVIGRKLFAWIWLLRNASRYDFVIVRHMEFDPFALLFAPFVRNRILVHHSKEVLELRLIRRGWKGRVASFLERITGKVAVRTSTALLGVTQEVCDYQRSYRKLPDDFPIFLFPNGVVLDTIEPLDDERSASLIEIAFMCGSFAQWHGLDILLDSLSEYCERHPSPSVRLHLIGKLSDEQNADIAKVNDTAGAKIVLEHGRMQQSEYRKIMEKCHVGVGSLAMDRIQMVEGATLKVREMLAMGLPIYSGHKDTALPPNFPHYFIGNGEFSEIISFVERSRTVSRQEVREASREYIEKRRWFEKLASFLFCLKYSGAEHHGVESLERIS
jgi:hypothetical protein